MNEPRQFVVGVDLGGTQVRSAVAPLGASGPGEFEIIHRGPTPRHLTEFVAIIDDARRHAARLGEPTAIGVAVPGLVDDNLIRWAPNTSFLDGVGTDELSTELRVVVANDAHLSLLGEAVNGAARHVRDAVLLAIGTGIGSAVMADRSIVRGTGGAACSGGWICADVNDADARLDGSDIPGRTGWLERQASGTAFDAAARMLDPSADGYSIIDQARRARARGHEMVERAGRAIGIATASLVVTLAPQLVLVSGGLSSAWDLLGPYAAAELARHTPRHLARTPIVAGTCGPHAALVGALHAAQRGHNWWKDLP